MIVEEDEEKKSMIVEEDEELCLKKNETVNKKEKAKTCDEGSQEDGISKLPDLLISDNILSHLSTKDAVRTSVLSAKWRNLWKWVPELDLDSCAFSSLDAFVNFGNRFFDSHRESWIRKLKLRIHDSDGAKSYISSWIDAVTKHGIQQLDVSFTNFNSPKRQLSITCETLVQLRLCWVAWVNAEYVSLPCLKIMHLEFVTNLNEATIDKLISGSPVLEDLTIFRPLSDNGNVIQVRSQTLKRLQINVFTEVVIDAPLLQFLKTQIFSKKNFKIINSGFPDKVDIDHVMFNVFNPENIYYRSMVFDILTDISKVRDLVITSEMWKEIFLYSKSERLLQFPYLSCLNAGYYKSDLELLPILLKSCPKLECLILEEKTYPHTEEEEPNVMFSTVPWCLVSSLKFVELKRSIWISDYKGEMELVRYILKNSTVLEKLKLDNYYYTEKEKDAILAMPRCSTACEVFI